MPVGRIAATPPNGGPWLCTEPLAVCAPERRREGRERNPAARAGAALASRECAPRRPILPALYSISGPPSIVLAPSGEWHLAARAELLGLLPLIHFRPLDGNRPPMVLSGDFGKATPRLGSGRSSFDSCRNPTYTGSECAVSVPLPGYGAPLCMSAASPGPISWRTWVSVDQGVNAYVRIVHAARDSSGRLPAADGHSVEHRDPART
jgi:hypothetical protein